MKIFVVGGATYYTSFITDVELVDNVESADVVLFTGGEDVSPSVYGCKRHKSTHCNINRDKEEQAIFKQVKPSQLCVGICRGSQFLCAMNGGILVQDCTGHACWGTHGITNGDIMFQITSTHHQMQYPYNLKEEDYDVIYTSDGARSVHYYGDKINADTILQKGEPEIVLYHKQRLPRCLAIQGHPEMIPESPVAEMINNLIHSLLI